MNKRRKQLPSGTFTAEVISTSHEGRGIAKIDGKTTFILGALAGEQVEFRYTQQRGSFDEGLITTVLQPATASRAEAKCQHFLTCGGCSLQHVKPEIQRQLKRNALLDMLGQQNITATTLLDDIISPSWHYRRKARLSVKYVAKKNKVLIGFRERQSRYVADLTSCQILPPVIGEQLTTLSSLIHELSIRQHIPQIEVIIADDANALIIRHLQPLNEPDTQKLLAFAKQHQWRLYLQPKGLDSITLLYPDIANHFLHYELPDYQLSFAFRPEQFIQVNAVVNQQMVAQAVSLLDLRYHDHVLDLFCGIGNFSLPMAKFAKQVTGIEGDASAIEMAKYNSDKNHIVNAEFDCEDLSQANYNYAWTKWPINKVLLDPPRSGAWAVLPTVVALKPSHIVYVSCNPATLVRDLGFLQAHNYRLEKIGIIDMFPHTQHIETMALLKNE